MSRATGIAANSPGVYLSAMWGPFRSEGAETGADAHGGADEVGREVEPDSSSKSGELVPLLIGAVASVAAVVAMLIVVSQPRPEATLDQTGEPAGLDVLVVVNSEPQYVIDGSTLRQHEGFQGWDIWSGSNAFGAPCLVAIAPDGQWVRVECTPEPAKLVADTFPYELPGGGMIRFVLDGAQVDAWVYPGAGAD
jgi:hypothetical protein